MAKVMKAGFLYCKRSQESLFDTAAPIHFTHLYCAFADVSSAHHVTIPDQYSEKFSSFTDAMRNCNQDVITLISIGGVDSTPSTFASMVSERCRREVFIRSSILLARDKNFDGLDLCWQWPSTPEEMENLGSLLVEWRQAIIEEVPPPRKTQLLLSATVFYKPTINSLATYPAGHISNNLDWINIWAYDFYNPTSSPAKTGPPAALRNPREPGMCVDDGISAWIRAGVQGNKLVLGLPFVGRAWSLKQPEDMDKIIAPAKGMSPVTQDGNLFYQNIREFIDNHKFTPKYNRHYVTNYCYKGKTWIGYDDKRSIREKIRYARTRQLRGHFAWHVGADDPDWTLSETAFQEWDQPGQDEDE